MNKVILMGNLGSDPEVRNTTSGKAVASFSLATSERFKDKYTGEAKSVTDWHNVVLWGAIAEIAGKYLRKGSKVLVEGKIKTRSYDSNGAKKFITEIIGDTLELIGEKPVRTQEVVESSGHATAENSSNSLPF
jgi:single-strand DNA-binding protein